MQPLTAIAQNTVDSVNYLSNGINGSLSLGRESQSNIASNKGTMLAEGVFVHHALSLR